MKTKAIDEKMVYVLR